jgi:hypothetical protein
MNIDAFGGVPPPQAFDVKTEKKDEADEPRPVEQGSESSESDLDVNKQKIAKEKKTKYVVEEDDIIIKVYNAKGNLVRKIPPGYVTTEDQGSINLTI